MNTSTIVSYAVWISMSNSRNKIDTGFRALWDDILKYWELRSYGYSDTSEFEPWLKVGNAFYLLHTESHCSPGDICGFLKGNKLFDPEDEIVAVRIDPKWYIPHQGLSDKKASAKLAKWKDQAEHYYFVRCPLGPD
jgi:hypothetical protein